MPEIQITMKDRGIDVRRRIAKAVTEVIVRETSVNPELVTIHFYHTDETLAAKGGLLMADRVGADMGAEGQHIRNLRGGD